MTRQTISDRIREARTDAGLTQRAAAAAIGVAASQWNRWEKGTGPHSETLPAIAKVIKVDPAWLAWG